jgi:coiled-coil domain-containing protein 130
VELGKEMWEAQRERAGLAIESGHTVEEVRGESSTRAIKGTPMTRKGKGRAGDGSGTPDLASLLRKTTARKYDPFSDSLAAFTSGSPIVSRKSRVKETVVKLADPEPPDKVVGVPKTGMAVLAGYDSD